MKFDGWTVEAGTLQAHAAELLTLRIRLAEVGSVYEGLEWNDESFGSLSGWIAESLARVTARHIELIHYVAENFELVAEDLWRAAEVREETASAGTAGDQLVVVIPRPRPAHRPATRFADLHARISDGDWVDEALAGIWPAARPAGPDPFAELPASVPAWTMTHLEPLRSMLRGLAGRPELVTAQATAVHATAAELHTACLDLQRMLRAVERWPGRDVENYLELMDNNVDGLAGLVGTSTAIALCAETGETLVASVRGAVHDLVAELVAEVVVLAERADDPEQAVSAAVARCHQHALRHVAALVSSLTGLAELIDG